MPFLSSLLQAASLRTFSVGLVSSRRPSVWAGHPKPKFTAAERSAQAEARPGVSGADRLAISRRSVRFALSFAPRLPRCPCLGERVWADIEPRDAGKRNERVFAPYPLEVVQKSFPRSHWAGWGLGPSRKPVRLAGRPTPGFTPHPGSEKGWFPSLSIPAPRAPPGRGSWLGLLKRSGGLF